MKAWSHLIIYCFVFFFFWINCFVKLLLFVHRLSSYIGFLCHKNIYPLAPRTSNFGPKVFMKFSKWPCSWGQWWLTLIFPVHTLLFICIIITTRGREYFFSFSSCIYIYMLYFSALYQFPFLAPVQVLWNVIWTIQ